MDNGDRLFIVFITACAIAAFVGYSVLLVSIGGSKGQGRDSCTTIVVGADAVDCLDVDAWGNRAFIRRGVGGVIVTETPAPTPAP